MAETTDFLPLPHLALHVLLALAEGEGHGWAVIRRIEELTGGVWSPSAGSLYLAMVRLEKQRLIEAVASPPDATDARRRYYRLTALGRQVLAGEMARLDSLVARGRAAGLSSGA
jgi:DNA-binding PadR family transcriptional regulator